MLTLIKQLAETIGLEIETVGFLTLRKAIEQRMQHCQCQTVEAYRQHLAQSSQEWHALIESVVIPETWFMRGQAALQCVTEYIKNHWFNYSPAHPLRILSVPCSTGEEPYSLAITLLAAGLTSERFSILGVDINQQALQHAAQGIYTTEAFRGNNEASYQQDYFESYWQDNKHYYNLHSFVKRSVQFKYANIVDSQFLKNEAPFETIFCRNLLIYLNPSAREILLNHLYRLLKPEGLLFVGHAERPHIEQHLFEFLPYTSAFACRRLTKTETTHTTPQSTLLNQTNLVTHSQQSIFKHVNLNTHNARFEQQTTAFSIFEQLFEKAQQLANQGDFKQALFYCQACLTEKNDSTEAYFLMAMIYLALNEFIQVEQYLNKTLYLNPTHQAALTHLILLAEKRGELQKTQQLRQRLQRVRERIT